MGDETGEKRREGKSHESGSTDDGGFGILFGCGNGFGGHGYPQKHARGAPALFDGNERVLVDHEILAEGLTDHGDHRLSTTEIDHSLPRLENLAAHQVGRLLLTGPIVGQMGFID